MRRFRDRRPNTLFRGAELPRLLTLVVMLGVLVLLMGRARDPSTWHWLAPDAAGQNAGKPTAALHEESVVADDPTAKGPTDLDPQELDAAREEFQAITDKGPLSKEEMPAYWRLMAWQQHQSTRDLRERAKKDVTFRKLWQEPQKWRGTLVELPVHLRQTAKADDLEDNSLGLSTMHEVWGWNTDSQPYWYWLVCPQLPPGMPAGQNIFEEATFVGYFLKLLPYEDHQGKTLATPLLIGRLIWHPAADNPLVRSDEWTWPWIAAAGLALLAAARWGLYFAGGRSRARRSLAGPAGNDEKSVEDWLERAEGSNDEHHRDDPKEG
ncbi:MAG: hypothetical protein HY288_02945 [Planctomycetia bacterium]|nr:hypothetical protein [Planctomycetia bacterium]